MAWTAKDLFENMLIHVMKEESPHFHLREFNVYANRAVNDFVRDAYMAFETNQNVLDAVKPLKSTFVTSALTPSLKDGTQEFQLPEDYRHLTNLIVFCEVVSPIRDECYEIGDIIPFPSKRLDSDLEAGIKDHYFYRPRYFRPYHEIFSNNPAICRIHTGLHPGVVINNIKMDYLKSPNKITLTHTQAFVDTVDTSQTLEFSDDTCERILTKLVMYVQERNGDPRTSTTNQVSSPQPVPDMMQRTTQQ